jgi:hypothetical protein
MLHPDGRTEPLDLPRKGEHPRLAEILCMFLSLRAIVFELQTGYVVIGMPYHPGLLLEYNSRASALVKDCEKAVSLHGLAILAPREAFSDSILPSDVKKMRAAKEHMLAPASPTPNATVEVPTTQDRERPSSVSQSRSKGRKLTDVFRECLRNAAVFQRSR